MDLPIMQKEQVFVQPIAFSYENHVLEASILRLDQIHRVISGNKFFKLLRHFDHIQAKGITKVASFGGAYSNHIAALAAACHALGLGSVGIIRGDAPAAFNHTLAQAKDYGMELQFVSRMAYQDKAKLTSAFESKGYYVIPEGGYGKLGAEGVQMMYEWIDAQYTDLVCAVGTGTTMAGLVKGATPHQRVWGVSVLKGYPGLNAEMESLLTSEELKKEYQIVHDYHFGGYAKYNKTLLDFMNQVYAQCQLPTDFVYTAKMLFATWDMHRNGHFDKRANILLIHTGGLQGNKSLTEHAMLF